MPVQLPLQCVRCIATDGKKFVCTLTNMVCVCPAEKGVGMTMSRWPDPKQVLLDRKSNKNMSNKQKNACGLHICGSIHPNQAEERSHFRAFGHLVASPLG
jgi:hypothetical protein